jgi:hypothetical protein
MFFPWCERTSFTPIPNKQKYNFVFSIVIFIFLDNRWEGDYERDGS